MPAFSLVVANTTDQLYTTIQAVAASIVWESASVSWPTTRIGSAVRARRTAIVGLDAQRYSGNRVERGLMKSFEAGRQPPD